MSDMNEKTACGCHEEAADHGCSCGCDRDCDGDGGNELPLLTVGAVLFAACMILEHTTAFAPWVYLVLYLIPYLLVGHETLMTSAKRIVRGAVFDENFLMSLASVGAFCIGQYEEGTAVMLLYHLG